MANLQQFFDSVPQQLKLDNKLDSEHGGVETDLGTIADSMDEWEGKIAEELKLTRPEIEAIKTENPGKLNLQTRAALRKWKNKFYGTATYRNLIKIFVRAGKGECAEAVCNLLRHDECVPQSKRAKLDPIQQYAMHLKGVYGSLNSSSDKFPLLSCSKFINLALVKKKIITRSEADRFTKATLHGHIDEILKKKEPVKLEEVFNPTEGQPDPKCIFLEGAPGIGKSTCVGELCKRWDKIDALKKCSLVILVRLREKQVQEAQTVEGLCYHRNKELRQAVAAEIEACEGRGVLFILDGFDELPSAIKNQTQQSNSMVFELIQGTYLSHSKLLVTSRPSATADFLAVVHCNIHRQIEVIGFTQDNIKEYAKTVFSEQRSVLQSFLKYISVYPTIKSMMYIPLNCALIVEIYRHCGTVSRPIPRTMTQLYVEMCLTLLRRHFAEDDGPLFNQLTNISSLDQLKILPQIMQPFLSLAEHAYNGLEKSTLVFGNLGDDFEDFGFMNAPTELYLGKKDLLSKSFLHLTLQEFLAAFYISQFPAERQQRVFGKYFQTLGWDTVWRFVAGLTGFTMIGWDSVISLSQRNTRLWPFLIRCLYEAQNKVDRDSILRKLSDSEVNFTCSNLTMLDCYSLGYCVVKSNHVWNIDLSNNSLGSSIVEMLTLGLRSSFEDQSENPPGPKIPNILSLNLQMCGLDLNGFSQLASIINHMEKLKKLVLQDPISSEGGGLVPLFNALIHVKTLHSLDVVNCNINCADIQALSKLLTTTSIKELKVGQWFEYFGEDFDQEDMSPECMEMLLDTVLKPCSLESVEISGVTWTPQAVTLLKENTSLKKLINNDTETMNFYEAFSSLAKALCKNSCLEELCIFCESHYTDTISEWRVQEIHDNSVKELAKSLRENSTLKSLILLFGITENDVYTLNEALCQNQTLQVLELFISTDDIQIDYNNLDRRIKF